MGVNTSGLLFKKEVANNRQYLENLLQKKIVREEKLPYLGNEFTDVSSDQIMAISHRGATLLHVDFDDWQDVIDRMGSDFNNRDGVGFMLSETSMTFMFQFPSRYAQNIDVYSYDDGFHCEGPNRLDIEEDDDIVFDVLEGLVDKYLGDISEAEFTLYHFGDGDFQVKIEENILTSTGDLPSIPRVESIVKPPEVDLMSPEPMAKEQVEAEKEVEHTEFEFDTEFEFQEGNETESDATEPDKSVIQEELEAYGRSYKSKELSGMSVDELIEEFWYEAFQAEGNRDPAIVRYVIELRRRGVKAEKGKGHTLMYHHSKYAGLQAEAKRLSTSVLEQDINRGRHVYSNGLDCIRTSVLEEEKRLRNAEAMKNIKKDTDSSSTWSVIKMILIGAGILFAIAKGCG
jgi:hypothetical protein